MTTMQEAKKENIEPIISRSKGEKGWGDRIGGGRKG